MSHLPANTHKNESVRLFKSDFLEFFSHISPVTITVIWAPVAVYFFVRSILDRTPVSVIAAAILIGLFLWTLAEYTLHRFVFHFKARSPKQERVIFLFHGVHHAYPQDKTRLVMPPPVSIPLALVFFGLFSLILGVLLHAWLWIAPMLVGFIIGYLAYDLTHYATHHFAMRSGAAKWLKRYHMQHHYKTPNARFGVSSPLWDFIFRTMPT
jgi:sterol desaturase/sphingolipid hydroxylase (fatty acid hydroxylase superfamily)